MSLLTSGKVVATYAVDGQERTLEFPNGTDPMRVHERIVEQMFPGQPPRKESKATAAASLTSPIPSREARPPSPAAAAVAGDLNHRGATGGCMEAAGANPQRGQQQRRAAGVRETSIEALRALKASGELSKQQQDVLAVMALGAQRDWTRQELAEASGLPINCITGRVHELLTAHEVLVELQPRKCAITGNTAAPVCLAQNKLFKAA